MLIHSRNKMQISINEVSKMAPSDSQIVNALNQFLPKGFGRKDSIQKVLLITPPDVDASMFNFATAKRGRYLNYPPYGLASLASYLRLDSIDVRILNLNNSTLKAAILAKSANNFDFDKSWQEDLTKEINEFKPDLIGITCMFTQTHRSLCKVVYEITESHPNTPIVIGGVHITNSLLRDDLVESTINDLEGAGCFFLYEADKAFSNFIRILNGSEVPSKIAQLFIRSGKGSNQKLLKFTNRMTPSGEDLNIIPAHDLINPTNTSKYGKVGAFYCFKPQEAIVTTVLSNRGCRAQCTFCSVRNFNGVGVRRRSVESVVDELLMLQNEYGVSHIMWLDDDFLYDRKKTLELFNEMIKRGVHLTWDCTNGVIASSCTDEVMSAAADSGCIGLQIGMESGNREILKQIKKPGTVETFIKAAEVLKRYEQIHSRVFLMIGFPGETYGQILDTINLAKTMALDWHSIQLLQPLPNTPIFEGLVDDGQIDPTDHDEVRYFVSSYGKGSKKTEQGADILTTSFLNAFNHDLTKVPPKENLPEIWAYMAYILNYERITSIKSEAKLGQQSSYLQHLVNIIAPYDAFALYYICYIEKNRGNREVFSNYYNRLTALTNEWPVWHERFQEFGLNLGHLKN
jgi:radical SAM superfamily enzyme YgiQ (UPF0313 family)